MVQAANLGYPRFGAKRELKRALENFWAGKLTDAELHKTGRALRLTHWQEQRDAGLDVIPSNDFSLYDQVLDTSLMVGAIPERFAELGEATAFKTYFAMARGFQQGEIDIHALEMTKWFDTNYHYLVPEIAPDQRFRLTSTKAIDEYREAKEAGFETRPVMLGPVSYLILSKPSHPDFSTLDVLPALLTVYYEVLEKLAAAGASGVQIDEPYLVRDLHDHERRAFSDAYTHLVQCPISILLATYFGDLGDNLPLVSTLPIAGLHIDLVRGTHGLDAVLDAFPTGKTLSLGVVDGRNVWRTDLDTAMRMIRRAVDARGSEGIQVTPSCSLLFSPHDLALETELDAELRSWLAFARQKLDEVVLLKRAANEGVASVEAAFTEIRNALLSRKNSSRTYNPTVRQRIAGLNPSDLQRDSSHAERKSVQASVIPLPPLPTTTIGSFPQTGEVRRHRALFNKGDISQAEYDAYLKAEIARTVRVQEDIGLDVLVHGEFERTDMVEYFGEQLTGIAFTEHGWVQSYGSRGVRPPIIYGDVSRPAPMTVAWSTYAQSLTTRPMKGMLTGPVTILEWSFVRDDQPRAQTCQQIALALRDEVYDLEQAGIRIIQIDEPALREGLPLRAADQKEYLRWAVECFRMVSSGVMDTTQIHTHMCYSEFNDILDTIARMDADVISIEASRSNMELLEAFRQFEYPNDIGPGVYDIHSPSVPSEEEIEALLVRATQVLDVGQLWVNPDCGLKTRDWDEVKPALQNMVAAARKMRLVTPAGVNE